MALKWVVKIAETYGRVGLKYYFGGREGIRTLDKAFDPIHTFQACAFDHSATLPFLIDDSIYFVYKLKIKKTASL